MTNANYEAYGTVNHLKRLSNRNWGFYDKPFEFNIAVQTLDEINNHKEVKKNDRKDHKLCNVQTRYAF